ncbi:MAG: isoprenylcysteine carboxylmethyltransferase family protein [Candidatus Didemnitutus sp.]|nr:isoprenylcysteine carboxylmethyltransferase family protein [Candidatus Didemnitutus sp.]
MILLLKNLLFTLLVPGFVVGWMPLYWLESQLAWPDELGPYHLIGLALGLLGFAAYLHCLGHFMVRGQGTPAPIDPPKKLMRRGLFAWVRNPFYLSVLAMVAAEGIFLLSWHIAIYWVVLASVFQLFVVLYEEQEMSLRYGAMYDDYKQAVPRWFPRRPPNTD